jgi:hypothetical protein
MCVSVTQDGGEETAQNISVILSAQMVYVLDRIIARVPMGGEGRYAPNTTVNQIVRMEEHVCLHFIVTVPLDGSGKAVK